MQKTLLYVVRYPLYEGFNLKQKFDGQIKAFQNLGYKTLFIGFDKEFFYLIDGDKKSKIGKTHFTIPNYFHTFLYADLYNISEKIIRAEKIDIVYFRNAAAFHSLYNLAKTIKKRKCKFVFEIPTYTPQIKEKALSTIREIFNLYARIWEKKIEVMPDLYVFMGDGDFDTFHGVPAIRIENGIDPELMPMRTPVCEKDKINILALSSMCDWHGYDRIINSLAEYDGNQNVIIHMVGGNDGGCLTKWKALVEDNHLDENVIFHGPLYGKDLDNIFDLCDIGVNSLGMYRKGLSDTSELKLREYISRGLPFVCSVYDVALDDLDKQFWFRVSNDDAIPNMKDILEFANRMRNNSTVAEKLHKHAMNILSWTEQYRKVFKFLEGE